MGKRWWLRKAVVVCGSDGGMPDQKLTRVRRESERWMEVMLSGAGCPGLRAGYPGWPDCEALG